MTCVLSRDDGFGGPQRSVLVLNAYCFVWLIDATTLVVWRQHNVERGLSAPLAIRVFGLDDLSALDADIVTKAGALRPTDATFSISTAVSDECELDTTVVGRSRELSFPTALASTDEMLFLCHSSAIKDDSNLGLIVAQPSKGLFEIHPQDWFNKGKLDYGYQWITRVARNHRTGLVEGEGMRIAPFVLDETLRGLLR